MVVIINPRGTGGAGKTALVRCIMAEYGTLSPIHRAGRARPIGYRLPHPAGGRPLAVLGAYEATRGGCDTIPERDGGLEEAFRLTMAWAGEGHDVLLEGLQLSVEHRRTAALAAVHPLHVLRLTTPAEDCARALVVRRRARRAEWRPLTRVATLMDMEVEAACRALQASAARVERLGFEEALRHARALLGLAPER